MFKSDISERNKETEAFLRVIPFRAKRTCFMVELVDSQTTTVDLRRMIEEGMNVCTVRPGFFSEDNLKRLIRRLSKACTQVAAKNGLPEWPCMLAIPLKTKIVTTGLLADDKDYLLLKENMEVLLTNDVAYNNQCTQNIIYVDNSHLTKEAKVGMEINLDEGKVTLECVEIIDKKTIKTVVTQHGTITHMVQVNFRGGKCLRSDDISNYDSEIIEYCKEHSVDALVMYYVSSASTIKDVLNRFKSAEHKPFVFVGICDEAGVQNLDEIIRAGRPIYISGGVFSYLVEYGFLVHSEIADIKNSILNGVSGFCVRSGTNANLLIETHVFLKDLCLNLEAHYDKMAFRALIDKSPMPLNAAEAAVVSCIQVAHQTDARLIIVPTVSGQTALALSRYWPSCLILAVSTNLRTVKMLAAIRDVVPLKCYPHPPGKKFTEIIVFRIEFALEYAMKKRWIEQNQPYVTLQRSSDTVAYCDMVKMWDSAHKEEFLCPVTPKDYP